MSIELRTFDAESSGAVLDVVNDLYDEVFVEPPYCEGPDDVADFVARWPKRRSAPAFRLVIAYDDGRPVGFSFGRQLPEDSEWWAGLLVDVPAEVTREWAERTFVVTELAVIAPFRGRGIARQLHSALLADRAEERAALLCRPEAAPAQAAYRSWGYRTVGPIRPYEGAPVYDAMVLPLR